MLAVADTLPIPVAFRPRRHANLGTLFCGPTTDRDRLALAWIMGCVVTLQVVMPDRIECVGSSPVPTAGELAAAIVANARLGAIDLGPVSGSPILPPSLFGEPVDGRIEGGDAAGYRGLLGDLGDIEFGDARLLP